MDAHMYSICQSGVLTGRLSTSDSDWLGERGPGTTWVDRVRTPALVLGGTIDTLFTLAEATENYRVLRSNGVPARMMWFCGGHGTCHTSRGSEGYFEDAVLRWLGIYLKGESAAAAGPGFEWVDQEGSWHEASDYPLADAGTISATGDGTLQLVAGDAGSSGTATGATPSSSGVDISIRAPDRRASMVGPPALELDYRAQGQSSSARAFAQIVDEDRDIVVGNQVTPLPLQLDDQPHTLRLNLETVAYALTPSSSLRLEIIPASNVYGNQHATGTVELTHVALTLPLGKSPVVVPPPAPPAGGCTPKFSPRRVERRDNGRVRIRPVVRCGGKRLHIRVKLSDGRRQWSRRTGKVARLRVRPKARRLVARFRHDQRAYRVRVRISN
jgi:ABC-2 type transport system ATP-binding protein